MLTSTYTTPEATELGGLLTTLAAADRFGTFLRAVARSDMTAELSGGEITLFVPNDCAFGRIPGWALRTLFRRPDRLRELVERHLVRGRHFSRELVHRGRLPNAAGAELEIARAGEKEILVNQIPVAARDIVAADGVAHELDGVIPGVVW